MSVPLLDVPAQNAPYQEELLDAFKRLVASGQFILGKEVELFEKQVADYYGNAVYALGVSSGTDALLVALMSLGIGEGDEVICPSFTFFATAGSIARTGATPVFCDCLEETFQIDWESAKGCLSEKTKAVIPVHLFGQSVDMAACEAFANEHGLAVIEDCAQSMGARYEGALCGSMGAFGALSFFPSKNLGGLGDGGMVLAQSEELYDIALKMRNHGMHPRYYHDFIGGNFRLDALQAAFLSIKMRDFDVSLSKRASNAAFYQAHLCDVEGLVLPVDSPSAPHTWNQFTVRVLNGQRDGLAEHLRSAGIGSAVYYPVALHQQACFGEWDSPVALPITEKLCGEVLSIPIYPELTEGQLAAVVAALRSFFRV